MVENPAALRAATRAGLIVRYGVLLFDDGGGGGGGGRGGGWFSLVVCVGAVGGDLDLGRGMARGDIFLIGSLGGRADNRGGDRGVTLGGDIGGDGGMRGVVAEVGRFWGAGGTFRREIDETGDWKTASRRVGRRGGRRGAESFGGVGARPTKRVMVVLGENI